MSACDPFLLRLTLQLQRRRASMAASGGHNEGRQIIRSKRVDADHAASSRWWQPSTLRRWLPSNRSDSLLLPLCWPWLRPRRISTPGHA